MPGDFQSIDIYLTDDKEILVNVIDDD